MLKVYYLKLSELADYPEDFFYPYVGEETCRAVKNMHSVKTRRTKLIGETIVRRIIQEMKGGNGTDYTIVRTVYGKPYIKDIHPALYFNISHSGDYIVVAFSDREVGIDIEEKTRCRMEVARRFFHTGEVAQLAAMEEEECRQTFFDYWSIKESYLKYTGSGLTTPLSEFQVCLDSDNIWIDKGGLPVSVSVQACRFDERYACFICTEIEEKAEVIPYLFPSSGDGLMGSQS